MGLYKLSLRDGSSRYIFAENRSAFERQSSQLEELFAQPFAPQKSRHCWWMTALLENRLVVKALLQLRTLMTERESVAEIVQFLAKQERSPSMQAAWHVVSLGLAEGRSFSASFPWNNTTSQSTILSLLLRWSEEAGIFHRGLTSLSHYIEQQEKIERQYKQLLYYPLTVLLFFTALLLYLLIFFLPSMRSFVKQETSSLLEVLFWMSDQLVAHRGVFVSSVSLLLLCMIIFPLIRAQLWKGLLRAVGSAGVQAKVDLHLLLQVICIALELNLPLLQLLNVWASFKGESGRFSAQMVVLLEAGYPLQEAVAEMGKRRESVYALFLGQQAKDVLPSLRLSIRQLHEEIATTIGLRTGLLAPGLLAAVGIVVGGLLYTIYVPLLSLPESVSYW